MGRGRMGSPHFILIVVNICKCIRRSAAEYHIEFPTYPRERERERRQPPQSFRISLHKNLGHLPILIAVFVLSLSLSPSLSMCPVHTQNYRANCFIAAFHDSTDALTPHTASERCLATKQEEARQRERERGREGGPVWRLFEVFEFAFRFPISLSRLFVFRRCIGFARDAHDAISRFAS